MTLTKFQEKLAEDAAKLQVIRDGLGVMPSKTNLDKAIFYDWMVYVLEDKND